ncbi:hypothetical protein ACLOJK_031956 [Asimina triloba]
MASDAQETMYDAVGQAQVKKEELTSQASPPAQSAKDSSQQQGADQSGSFLQQTGEQVKSMAEGAAGAVKNTLGMGGNAASPVDPVNPANPTSDLQH